MIQIQTPITTSTFNGMWVTNLGIFFPTVEKPHGLIAGNLAPYDGTHLLLTGGKRLFISNLAAKLASDATLATIMNALKAEVKRQASKTVEPKFVTVNAYDPARPVTAQVGFVDGSIHTVSNCFALAATNPAFAGVFSGTMGEIARQAGLTVV